MGVLDTINDARRPGGLEALARQGANLLTGKFLGQPVISQNIQDAYGYFLVNLLQSTNSIALKPLWMCFLDSVPNVVKKAQQYDASFAGKHDIALGWSASTSSIDFRGAKAALLAQECNVPGESFGIDRPKSDYQSGFLTPGVTQPRNSMETVKIAYIETNYSFTDFALRPWSIVASYESLKFAPKTNITMINFAKAGSSIQFMPRKIITLHNCVPISIDSEPYTYGNQSAIIRQVEWYCESYTIKSGQLIPGTDLLAALDQVFNISSIGSTDIKVLGQSALSAASGLASVLLTNVAGGVGDTIGDAFGLNGRSPSLARRQTARSFGGVVEKSVDRASFTRSAAEDDVIPNPNDVVNSVVPEDVLAASRTLDDVITDQVNAALRMEKFQRTNVSPDADAPAIGRNLSVVVDDVKVSQNDVPAFRRGVPDDVRPLDNDIPKFNRVIQDDVVVKNNKDR